MVALLKTSGLLLVFVRVCLEALLVQHGKRATIKFSPLPKSLWELMIMTIRWKVSGFMFQIIMISLLVLERGKLLFNLYMDVQTTVAVIA